MIVQLINTDKFHGEKDKSIVGIVIFHKHIYKMLLNRTNIYAYKQTRQFLIIESAHASKTFQEY